jgi:CRP/FNR family transcriptional regulator
LQIETLNSAAHPHCIAISGALRGKLCERLIAGRKPRRIAANSVIYTAGDRSRGMYFLVSGVVKTSVPSAGGKELLLQWHRPGDIFGEICLCGAGRPEQAVATEPSEIVYISFSDLLSATAQNRQAAVDFAKLLNDRLAKAYEQLQVLSSDRRLERLARTLLALADQFGSQTPKGIRIQIYLTQRELAQMIATRREVISQLLARLRALGLISYSRQHRLTVRTEALRAYMKRIARTA